jgi:hypothetical protein
MPNIWSSEVVGVALHRSVVDYRIALDNSSVSTRVSDDGRSVESKLVVDNQEWVAVVNNIVVNTNTIEVLLQEVLEEGVFLLESGLLLLDGELIEEDLVVALVERV